MKKIWLLMLAMCLGLTLVACGDKEPESTSEELPFSIVEEPIEVPAVEEEEEEEEVAPENSYRSELTNEWISNDLKDQRPVAIMVDNEITALPHFGINSADIVYEMVNSTANDRVTRLMCIVKDWANLEQFGSIRSIRPTNLLIIPEYNAIAIHDGGPFYINDFIARAWNNNFSGGFARFSNGKATEFTEYVTSEDYTNTTKGTTYQGLIKRMEKSGYDKEYNEYYPGNHFSFNNKDTELTNDNATKATKIELPFPHNQSTLTYNEKTKLYEYSEYGYKNADDYKEGQVGPHIDPTDDNKVLSFKNVIIYGADMNELDEHGYMIYNVIGYGKGYYITDGKVIPITWRKPSETDITIFADGITGEDIVLNTGKTYIAIVPNDAYDEIVIK